MSANLAIPEVSRLLFAVPLEPVQGKRFQPTGFPNLGAATYQTAGGTSLLVESAQSMANRLELTFWNSARNEPVEDAQGISHITVTRKGKFLTDSMLESHRINSPYVLEGKDQALFKKLQEAFGALAEGPIDRKLLAEALLRFDVGSLLHGVFLAKKELAGGRLRVARAISAFIEADDARVAASGGVKNDHVNPSGDAKKGFGNVPFARDEFTAAKITLYANIDLAQLRGYGLAAPATRMLVLMALYKLRKLLDADLRLRTACDLAPVSREVTATAPKDFILPDAATLATALRGSIIECKEHMVHTTVTFEDVLKKGKDEDDEDKAGDEQGDEA
jgi:CRISPR-associated protein Csb1